ncbi:hypothetical protein [Escherichia phage Ecp_YSF]|nr:hypothetical protein [Escherichia phage Ecp_YSF]
MNPTNNGFVELIKPARWDRDEASEADCVIVNLSFTESTKYPGESAVDDIVS